MNEVLRTILFLSLSGSLLAIILLAGKPFIKNRVPKAFSYYIWLLVLLRLVVPLAAPINIMDGTPFHFESPASGNVLPEQTDSPGKNNTDQVARLPTVAPQQAQPVFSQEQQNTETINTQAPAETQQSFDPWDFIRSNLLWVWLAGAVVSLGWVSIAYAIFSWRIRRSCTAPHGDDIEVFERLRGVRRVRLFCSSCVTTPMFIGVLRPVIVLPQIAYVRNGMEKELNHILRHELTHYRRKDMLYKWLVVMVTSLHWFNPLMILIRREIGRDCELACDEAVIGNMPTEERRFYGNMLLSLAANRKLSGGILATTLCEEKKELKERLIGIKNYKKKTAWAVTLTLVLALFLTGCAAVLGVSEGLNGIAVQKVNGKYEEQNNNDGGQYHNDGKQHDHSDVQASNLQALTTRDRYENGKMFEAVSAGFANSFQDKVAGLTIPDARKGEHTADVRSGSEGLGNSAILYLDSIPDQDIYLYGYYEKDYPGYGLILDVGREQHIYAFPYRYMTNTWLVPDLSASSDGRRIYVSCHTGGGTGVSVSELYVFQVSGDRIEPYYVDINDLADCLGKKITMSYEPESKKVQVHSGSGKQILSDSLISIGAADSGSITPDGFYCGEQINYTLYGDAIRVSWVPTLYSQNQPGAQSYLENLAYLKADMSFVYADNGSITGFDIGEAMANAKITARGDFDGDGLTDYVNMESGTEEVKFTVNFGNGNSLDKSIGSSNVSWMDWYTLMAGDIDRDGKDELVFAPAVRGSNYGAKDLYVFRVGKDGLTAIPLNCVKNTVIGNRQVESLNEEYICIGAEVIDTDNGQLLRVRRLINAQENSAWYIDVRWNGNGWQIENVRTGSAYGEEAVYQYAGSITVAGKRQKCNITVRRDQEGGNGYVMDFTLIDSNSKETLQQLQYKLPEDFMPGTIQDGSRILDVNHDGNDDIMLDLGVYGWPRYYACFVYDSSRNEYRQVPQFEEHPFPYVLSDQGVVLFHWKDGAATYGVDKYQIEGNQLHMLGCLTKIFGQSGVRYTEETMVGGVLVKIKEDVTAKEIDHFDAWNMWD